MNRVTRNKKPRSAVTGDFINSWSLAFRHTDRTVPRPVRCRRGVSALARRGARIRIATPCVERGPRPAARLPLALWQALVLADLHVPTVPIPHRPLPRAPHTVYHSPYLRVTSTLATRGPCADAYETTKRCSSCTNAPKGAISICAIHSTHGVHTALSPRLRQLVNEHGSSPRKTTSRQRRTQGEARHRPARSGTAAHLDDALPPRTLAVLTDLVGWTTGLWRQLDDNARACVRWPVEESFPRRA